MSSTTTPQAAGRGLASAPVAVQARSRRTRRALLDAGLALLEEQGPDALTISAVSSRAGVAAGTIYRRFGDKDGLLAELQEEFTAGFRQEFADRMSATRLPEGAGPEAAIGLAVRALADTFRDHETLLRVFVLLGMADNSMAERGARASHEGGQLFRNVLWPHRGAFTNPDPERAIDIAHRLVYATCMHRVLLGPNAESPTELPWDALADELSRTVSFALLGSVPER